MTPQKKKGGTLSREALLGALGVVYGDIGTSPLYALKQGLSEAHGVPPAQLALGMASLILWCLLLVVGVKYVTFIMRADNHGEGGILALLALLPKQPPRVKALPAGVLVILAGASLLYGDGLITPAISVLSAAEGLRGIGVHLEPWIPPIAATILGILFALQSQGTARIGWLFGPIMLVWFLSLAAVGITGIVQAPEVWKALNPGLGLGLLIRHPAAISSVLGAVVLAITGVEALYADMGHFGRRAVTVSWYALVLPSLFLSYLGQAGWILKHGAGNPAQDNPLFTMVPGGPLHVTFVLLALAATIIASQALIAGIFTMTHQAAHLGYFPHFQSRTLGPGRVYMPGINWILGAGCLLLVCAFRSSQALGSAYGIAVAGTMAATTFAFFRLVQVRWQWPPWASGSLCAAFLAIDLTFLIGNLPKIPQGGWVPLFAALAVFIGMSTWKRVGNEIREELLRREIASPPLEKALKGIARVPGTGIFMSVFTHGLPVTFYQQLTVNRSLCRTAVLLTVFYSDKPRVPREDRLRVRPLGHGVWRVVVRHGFGDEFDLPRAMHSIKRHGIPVDSSGAIYHFFRKRFLPQGKTPLREWQKGLYRRLSRNARLPREIFRIPPEKIVETELALRL